jgi:hypothetical protein
MRFTKPISLLNENSSYIENCLFAIKYDDETCDEFERLFDQWNDTEFLESFFEENKQDLQGEFWGSFSVENAVLKTINDASYLEDKLLYLSNKERNRQNEGLASLFRPLHNLQARVIELNKSKAKQNWLRLYALRIEKTVFIITGGAIKLSATMEEREHTRKELLKLEKCRRFLLERGIIDQEGIIEEIEM